MVVVRLGGRNDQKRNVWADITVLRYLIRNGCVITIGSFCDWVSTANVLIAGGGTKRERKKKKTRTKTHQLSMH